MEYLDPIDPQRSEKNPPKWDSRYLPIAYEYRPLFERLAISCEGLLHRPGISLEQKGLLIKLQYALGRLPVTTRDIDYVVILSPLEEVDYINNYALELSTRYFRASTSPVEDVNFSSELEYTRVILHCTHDGGRHDGDDDGYVSYALFESWLRGWESLCQDSRSSLLIYNGCEAFEWRQYGDKQSWVQMPSLFDTKERNLHLTWPDVHPSRRRVPRRQDKPRQISDRSLSIFQQASERLLSDLASPPNLTTLARACGTNRTTLQQVFQENAGMSVADYLREHRFQRAQALLAEGGYSIEHIAARVGYHHSRNFSRAYKQRYGQYPSQVKNAGESVANRQEENEEPGKPWPALCQVAGQGRGESG